jgi:lipoic acid synthetase
MTTPIKMEKGVKYRDADKLALIPVRHLEAEEKTNAPLKKPDWMRIKLPSSSKRIDEIKAAMREHKLHSVCEEASCPNLAECFNHGTATFMILGAICTRRCPFCDVAHGRPLPPSAEEPTQLAKTIRAMKLKYVVVTSVDRDDLRDGGSTHFSDCIQAIRQENPTIRIETLVPDFRGRMDRALDALHDNPPDVFNHNLETAPRLYRQVRPGANYQWSLDLLKKFKEQHPMIPTKSGLMMGLGETKEEIIDVLKDLRAHGVTMLTLGQYLAPSQHHLPVVRYVPPAEFDELKVIALDLGFTHAACGPFVRSSYHADLQAKGEEVK